MALNYYQRAILEDGFREGATLKATAEQADCCKTTAEHYFKRFADEGVPRGNRRLKQIRVGRRYSRYGWPQPYTGPEWIG